MKGFLLTYHNYGRFFLRTLGVCTGMVLLSLFAAGEARLFGALLLGYAAGALYLGGMALSLWKVAFAVTHQLRAKVIPGTMLRLMALLVIFGVAIQISTKVFWIVVMGFAIFVVIAMGHLIVFNYKYVNKN